MVKFWYSVNPLLHCFSSKTKVHQLVDACGGRLVSIGQGLAVVRFNGGYEYAKWAKKRLDGEEVFGNRIFVKIPFLDANAHKGKYNAFNQDQNKKPAVSIFVEQNKW